MKEEAVFFGRIFIFGLFICIIAVKFFDTVNYIACTQAGRSNCEGVIK